VQATLPSSSKPRPSFRSRTGDSKAELVTSFDVARDPHSPMATTTFARTAFLKPQAVTLFFCVGETNRHFQGIVCRTRSTRRNIRPEPRRRLHSVTPRRCDAAPRRPQLHSPGGRKDSRRNFGKPKPARGTSGLDLPSRRASISAADSFAEWPLRATPGSLPQCAWQFR
jgi:hypothetical protein